MNQLQNRFDLNLLRIFEAVYRCNGVSEAARQLHLSQPTISHALARLRAAFGDELFVRNGNGLVPTAAARSIIDPVRHALRGIDAALIGAQAYDPGTSDRRFTLGLRPAHELPMFAGLAHDLLAEAPAIRLASVYFARSDLEHALATGALDLALDIHRPPTHGLRSVALDPDALVVAVRHDHPIVAETLDIDGYVALDHVFASPRMTGSGPEDVALDALGTARTIKIRCQSAAAAWQIAGTSDLVFTLPRSFAAALQALRPLRVLPIPFPVTPSGLFLYWHRAFDLDPGGVWLRDRTLAYAALVTGHATGA